MDSSRGIAIFEFESDFVRQGIDLAPITMPLESLQNGERIFSFPHLNEQTFRKLPGMLADSLPDSFGNKLIDIWLAKNGRSVDDFSPVERLCYVGKKAIGALEYEPSVLQDSETNEAIQLEELVEIANKVVLEKEALHSSLSEDKTEALKQIISVGTSAGGMRPKAVIAIDWENNIIRSGYLNLDSNFEHWILKFDGIEDEAFGISQGYGVIEYVYSIMAKKAGINMPECRLFEENGRRHFMIKRFDRNESGKVHTQTLTGLAHYDFNQIGSTSYEQLFQVMRKLNLGYDEMEQMFRRMVFNVIATNQDDHPKNTSFILEKRKAWRLSPAYDLTYSYNPRIGSNTNKHQMSIQGKRSDITREDLIKVSKEIRISNGKDVIDEVKEAVSAWSVLASEYGLGRDRILRIADNHRMGL